MEEIRYIFEWTNERQWQTAADYSPGELPNKPMSSTQTNEKNSLMKIRFFVAVAVAGDGGGGAAAVLLYCCWCLCRTSLPFYVAKMVQILLCVRKVRNVYRIWLPNVYGKIYVQAEDTVLFERGRHLPLSYELSEHSQRYLWALGICSHVFCFGLLLFSLPSSIRNLHFTRVAVPLLLLLWLLLLLLLRSLASWFINPNNIPPLQNALYKSILQRTGRIMARGFLLRFTFSSSRNHALFIFFLQTFNLCEKINRVLLYATYTMQGRETFGVPIFSELCFFASKLLNAQK